MFFIKLIPYFALGLVLNHIDITVLMWQFWAILACMVASDIISAGTANN